MRCERCHGEGMEIVICEHFCGTTFYFASCPDCGGSGFHYCCEGERPDCAPKKDEDDCDDVANLE